MVKTEIYDPINQAAKEPIKKQGPKKKVSGKSASSKPETFAEKKARLAAEAQAASKQPSDAAATESQEAQAVEVPVKKSGKSETFAEKKARLDAEKKAAEANKAAGTTAAKPATTTVKKTTTTKAAKLYGIDKEKIAAARAAAAQKSGEGEQA